MRQTVVAAATTLALAACPEVATGPQGPEGPQGPAGYSALASGTRIKARVGTTPDGAKLFLGWHDVERGENCSFRTAADGKVRCLPDVYESALDYPGHKLFSDDACSVPAVTVRKCAFDGTCELPELALSAREKITTGNSDIGLVGVFAVAGPVANNVFERIDGECRGFVSFSAKAVRELSPSDFQAIEESLE